VVEGSVDLPVLAAILSEYIPQEFHLGLQAVFFCLFIVFFGGPVKERWIQGNDTCGSVYKIVLVQGPQKMKDESVETTFPGKIDRGFAVICIQTKKE
jgi:hypothetical protein